MFRLPMLVLALVAVTLAGCHTTTSRRYASAAPCPTVVQAVPSAPAPCPTGQVPPPPPNFGR